MSDSQNPATITSAHVSLTGLCIRKGCNYSGQTLMHTLRVCTPTGLTPCNRKDCLTPEPHGVHDCDPRFTPCLRTEHAELDDHLVIDCIDNPTYGESTSKELVLYTGPKLVHVGTICDDAECVIEGRHTIAAHVLCQNPNCPVGNDHLTDTSCESYRARSQYQTPRNMRDEFPSQTANKITSKMRLKRFAGKIRSTWQSLREDWVYLIACIPLVLGVLNSVYALGMLHGTTAQVMDTSVFNPIAVIISASFYALVVMIALDFTSKHQEIPAESSFNHYLNNLRTGTAFLATSCAFEVAVFLFQRR